MSESQPERKLIIEGDWKSQVEAERDEDERSESAKLQVDADWKAEAQAEKERLAAAEQQREKKPGDRERGLPEASFKTLMSILASQAIMGLGTMTDPQSGGVVVDLDGARLSIDLLDVLEQKTKGNLSQEESTELKQLLAELRARYVQIAQLVAQQQAQGGPGVTGGPGSGPVQG